MAVSKYKKGHNASLLQDIIVHEFGLNVVLESSGHMAISSFGGGGRPSNPKTFHIKLLL